MAIKIVLCPDYKSIEDYDASYAVLGEPYSEEGSYGDVAYGLAFDDNRANPDCIYHIVSHGNITESRFSVEGLHLIIDDLSGNVLGAINASNSDEGINIWKIEIFEHYRGNNFGVEALKALCDFYAASELSGIAFASSVPYLSHIGAEFWYYQPDEDEAEDVTEEIQLIIDAYESNDLDSVTCDDAARYEFTVAYNSLCSNSNE